MSASNKTNVVLWTSAIATVAGVVAVAVFVKLRAQSVTAGPDIQERLRDVQDVLADCHRKISDLEQQLPELLPLEPRFNNYTLSSGSA